MCVHTCRLSAVGSALGFALYVEMAIMFAVLICYLVVNRAEASALGLSLTELVTNVVLGQDSGPLSPSVPGQDGGPGSSKGGSAPKGGMIENSNSGVVCSRTTRFRSGRYDSSGTSSGSSADVSPHVRNVHSRLHAANDQDITQ